MKLPGPIAAVLSFAFTIATYIVVTNYDFLSFLPRPAIPAVTVGIDIVRFLLPGILVATLTDSRSKFYAFVAGAMTGVAAMKISILVANREFLKHFPNSAFNLRLAFIIGTTAMISYISGCLANLGWALMNSRKSPS